MTQPSRPPYSRHRTEILYSPRDGWYQSDTSNSATRSNISRVFVGKYKLTDDWVVPGFRKKSADGQIIMNPVYHVDNTFNFVDGSYGGYTAPAPPGKFAAGGGPWPHYIGLPQVMTTAPILTAGTVIGTSEQRQLSAEVRTRVLSQIGRSSTDQWENLAEISKTLTMLRHPIQSFLNWNEKNYLKSTFLSTSNAWLMYRYGIKPLVSSVDGILIELNRNIRPVRKTTRDMKSITASQSSDTGWDTAGHHYRYRIQKTETFVVRAMSIDEVTNSNFHKYGFAAKSLLTLPWELVPYSFVADWFANTGDYIGALANALQPASLGQCEVNRWVLSERRYTTATWADYPVVLTTPYYCSSATDTISYNRYPGLLSGPELTFKSDFKLEDATRVADSLALGFQFVARRFVPYLHELLPTWNGREWIKR